MESSGFRKISGSECWQTEHQIFGFFSAMPSIIIWGLGIPFFAFTLLTRERDSLQRLSTKEKFGFLYNGYKVEYYYGRSSLCTGRSV